jgi:hypothetical protein
MRDRRDAKRDAARRVLWDTRESNLPHLLQRCCSITDVVEQMCADAGWTHESYLLAALFDVEGLIVEVTK